MKGLQLLHGRFESWIINNTKTWVNNSWLHPGKIERQSIIDFLTASKSSAKGRLLDIGCGNRPYASIFSDVVDEYVGIDLPSWAAASKQNKEVDCYADGLNLPFKSESFDTVLTTQTLEHVPEPDMMFSEISRVLKDAGALIVTAPQTWELHEEPNDYYRYTKYGLEYLAKKNGLKIEKITVRRGFFAMAGQLLSTLVFKSLCVKKDGNRCWIVLQAPIRVVCAIIQMLAFVVDRLVPNYSNTLGHGIVAKKVS